MRTEMTYQRNVCKALKSRLLEKRRFIQVLTGPRQTGKTTVARQVAEELPYPSHYASADEPSIKGKVWMEQQWETARTLLRSRRAHPAALLILDEAQKLPDWSESAKRLWDEDTARGLDLRVVLLGSSPLLMQKGLSESLAGRFEKIPVTHWSYTEMVEAFRFSLDQYVFFGGYPGSASLIGQPDRWAAYINDSLIETTVMRDVLLLTRVDKPALLRRLFALGCSYSGQILSYQKMIGHLTDAGNTTTLAHYLDLLGEAGLLKGLDKYAGQKVRQRAASPKLLALNTGLMAAQSQKTLAAPRSDGSLWGRFVESAVGAHLANGTAGTAIRLYYWAKGGYELDYVLARGDELVAIEVKSSRVKERLAGMDAFSREFSPGKKLLVGGQGIPLKEFLSIAPGSWFI